jgi:hypothetical protein
VPLWPQELDYVKKASRDETRKASIDATLKKAGSITQSPWKFIGPFDNAEGKGAERVYPPEKEIDYAAEYVGADGRKAAWQDGAGAKFRDGATINCDLFKRLNNTVCYFHRTIEAAADMKVTFFVGSDDSISMWLNGERIHHNNVWRGLPAVKDVVPAELAKGKNSLLVKIGNIGGPTEFWYQCSLIDRKLLEKLEERLDADFPTVSERTYYVLETIETPKGVVFEVGGMGFWPDGTLVCCTRRGDIWTLKEKTWKRFAFGLHEPLGLWPGAVGEVWCVQRPELTRVVDENGDGEADLYETVSAGWGLSGHYHEFAFGPVRDKEGNFWGTLNVDFWNAAVGGARAKWRGWSFKVTPKGEFVPWSTGLRSPDGMGFSPEGDFFVTDNQGDYLGTSPLYHITEGAFHGHPAGLGWDKTFEGEPFKTPLADLKKRRKPPAFLFPHGILGHSPTQPIWDTTGGKFGPFQNHLFVGDQTQSFIVRVVLEKVNGEWQGAGFPFRAGQQSGNHRLAWAPDGSLWIGQTDRGWDSVGGKGWGLQKLTWTGKLPAEMSAVSLTDDGFEVTFTTPVDAKAAADPASWSMQHFHYNYWQTYGSPQVANTPVAVKGATLSDDGRKVRLVLPGLVEGEIYELRAKGVRTAEGQPLLHDVAYYTLNSKRK